MIYIMLGYTLFKILGRVWVGRLKIRPQNFKNDSLGIFWVWQFIFRIYRRSADELDVFWPIFVLGRTRGSFWGVKKNSEKITYSFEICIKNVIGNPKIGFFGQILFWGASCLAPPCAPHAS